MRRRNAISGKVAMCGLMLATLAACNDLEKTEFDQLLAEGVALYSRNKQEVIIRHFFRDRRNGVFLDVGCFTPIKNSTTYYLEKHLGWSGIGVDAQNWLRRDWKKQRPRSKFVNAVVSDKSGETVIFYVLGGISALNKENITRRGVKPKREVEHITSTLNDILSREGIEKIDFLSMDINGHDPAGLAGFDIKRYQPELVLVEVHERNRELLLHYFDENGYERIDEYLPHDTKTNWYFRRRAQAGSVASEG